MRILKKLTDGLTQYTSYHQVASTELDIRSFTSNVIANTVTVYHHVNPLVSVDTNDYAAMYTVDDIALLDSVLRTLKGLRDARELATDVGDYEGRQQEILIADAEELYKRT